MQHALLGVRRSSQGKSILFSPEWPNFFIYLDEIARARLVPRLTLRLSSRRHISFPGFISHLPPERYARTVVEDLTSRERGRGAHDGEDVSFSEGLRQGITQALSKQHKLPQVDLPPPGSTLYGKWHSLLLDEKRLLQEVDDSVSDSTFVREIDQVGNEHDIELWSCLLEFAFRRMGHNGVIMVWQSVVKRRTLYQVEGTLAQNFWAMILNVAVSDEHLLQDVVRYAQWLHQTHNVQWPRLYSTVMTYMLRELLESDRHHAMRWKRKVIRWHFAMAPSSSPSEAEFVNLLKNFILEPNPVLQETLQLLYTSSLFRGLYDTLVPYLYDEGHVQLAMKWRAVLVTFDDLPVSMAVRPFLRCVGGYYPRTRLINDELNLAGLVLNKIDVSKPDSRSPETAMEGRNLSYLINRVHGETFGITEKPYNDRLGAKWFASSWVSVDFAINVIYTMGIQMIGPLSLQSIALRERSAGGVLRRIDQLQQLNIALPNSNYVSAIRHYAAIGDDEALQELLHSDIHPDIFDDEEAQHKLIADCLRVGDWTTYRLLLSTRLAVVSTSKATAADRVLESYIRQRNGPMALQTMKEMSSYKIELGPTTSHMLSGFILHSLSPHAIKAHHDHKKSHQHIGVQVSLCLQLAATRFPPAVEVWQTILYRLGREKRLADLERLSLYIVRLYADHTTSEQPMWISHMADVPQILRSESPFPNFQKLPRGLPIRHEQHPLRQIFDANLQKSIVRWGFLYTSFSRAAEGAAATVLREIQSEPNGAEIQRPPEAFHLARGIRLLAMLRDEGVFVNTPSVKKQAELRLVDMYRGEGKATYEWVDGNPRLSWRRRQLRFGLAEAKRLCDEAWEKGEIVSSLLELERNIKLTEQMDKVKELQRRAAEMKDPKLARRRRR
ncbi:hypothetical protein N0V93_006557 [Gnomoniopsis smithogilvyi]|uniref:Pentatricopeptide repeat domain-containing protein n=1 Tax=Gnomoniopsis smithogilvyi TaxID=1191159 RepID=A0A9W8YNV1_9PEZI|nr:hypothetical protein N0V93_006557 [Gnomoniopsis smithogilvyi]